MSEKQTMSKQRGVSAVEVAAAILDVLYQARAPLRVIEISRACGFASAQVHHYLVSLVRTGFVRREGSPVRYALGPFAARLGLAAVDTLEIQHVSAPFLQALSDKTAEASFFSIWSPQGPLIVRWHQGQRPLTVYARLGTVMPLLRSATGEVFLAWGDRDAVDVAIENTLLHYPPDQRDGQRVDLDVRRSLARRRGYGATSGGMFKDIDAISTPIFERGGKLAGALTILGLAASIDVSPESTVVAATLDVARDFSAKMGFDSDT